MAAHGRVHILGRMCRVRSHHQMGVFEAIGLDETPRGKTGSTSEALRLLDLYKWSRGGEPSRD